MDNQVQETQAQLDSMAADDVLLNQNEVAEICRVRPKTIANWVAGANPDFPSGFKLGSGQRALRVWRKSVIIGFIREREEAAA